MNMIFRPQRVLFSVTLALALLFSGAVFSQKDSTAVKYASEISRVELRSHLEVIASDALQGRNTGEAGQKMAAAYISAWFRSLGLEGPVDSEYGNGYFQKVPLYVSKAGSTYVKAGEQTFQNFEQIIYVGGETFDQEEEWEVVFAGYGTEEELQAVEVKGKAVMVMAEGLMNGLQPTAKRISDLGGKRLLVVPQISEEEWNDIASKFNRWLSGGRLRLDMPDASEPGFYAVNQKVASVIFNKDFKKLQEAANAAKEGKLKSLKRIRAGKAAFMSQQIISVVESENVLGYLEGTDKKDELVVITAHYDHVGMKGKEIYNGADDDGSGTVAVMEIAQAFMEAALNGHGPRRSILFMTVTGEEKGLLGSEYYTRNPVFPLESTVVNLNIDMIGRIDPDHENNPNYVYVVGSDRLSTELYKLSERVNTTYTNLNLDYLYNDENHPDRIYYRSDHWNFAKNNVPFIFYFNGVHADYHKPTDTVEKIAFEQLEKRARLVFYTAWEIANRDNRLVVDKAEEGN